jgi:DtxR family Mn-dependent transcriptional regulator
LTKIETSLTALANGESGIITGIRGHGRHGGGWGLQRRLMEMGLTPGTRVTVVKSAPFNGPLEVLVRGSRLALGRKMAHRIYVEVDGDGEEVNDRVGWQR